MNAALYYVCIVLLIPVAGFAAFGLLIDSFTHFSLWEIIKFVFAPLYDPLGKGLWLLFLLLSFTGLLGVGFFPDARQYGFWTIAGLGVLCIAYVLKIYPGPWEFGHLFFFIPSLAGVSLSIYCAVRPGR